MMQSEEGNQESTGHQSHPNFTNNRQTSVASGMLNCPKCESSLISKPIGPVLVTISVVVFVILIPLLALISTLESGHIEGLFQIVLALSGVAIFVSMCVALAGRHRCLSCGHRFRATIKTKRRWMGPSFPSRFVIINAVLIFVFFMLSEILKLIYHGVFSIIISKTIFVVIGSAFWILLSLTYQVLLYEILKRRLKHNLLWATLFILPSIILGTNLLYASLPTVTSNRILTLAELAPLPASARDIKVYEWSFIFSGEKYLRFRASPSDIEKFLKESSILQNAECENLPAERMPVRLHNPSAPNWYKNEIKQGRLYIIEPEWGYYPGRVIVNDEEHFVYVNIIWS